MPVATRTMASSGTRSAGIQQLLAAEKKADERISRARTQKANRLKQAHADAKAEVEAYRAQRESEFQAKLQAHGDSTSSESTQLKADTDLKLAALKTNVAKSRDEVIKTLLEIVSKVEPTVHQNFKVAEK